MEYEKLIKNGSTLEASNKDFHLKVTTTRNTQAEVVKESMKMVKIVKHKMTAVIRKERTFYATGLKEKKKELKSQIAHEHEMDSKNVALVKSRCQSHLVKAKYSHQKVITLKMEKLGKERKKIRIVIYNERLRSFGYVTIEQKKCRFIINEVIHKKFFILLSLKINVSNP